MNIEDHFCTNKRATWYFNSFGPFGTFLVKAMFYNVDKK